MPHGVPTDERWTRVCGNIENIDKIKNAISSEQPQEEEINRYFRKFRDDDAVVQFSKQLRSYLSEQGQHTTMDSHILDKDLVNFDLKCEANKVTYYENYPNVLRICEKVFITPEDRDAHFDINNKTKAEIQKMIMSLLKDIDEAGGTEEAAVLRQQWCAEVKKATKNLMITFYREVTQCLADVTGRNEIQGDESEEEDSA